jgi:hypothetical protein
MVVFCTIPIQFLWGQGSSILPNKHTHSCSPQNSHLVSINQMEGNEMRRAISQCVPNRRGKWRLWEAAFHVSPSTGAQRAVEKPAGVWLGDHHDSPVPQLVCKNIHMHTCFSGQAVFCCLIC